MAWPDDRRIAQCKCGWGVGGTKTVPAVRSHQSHHKTPQCDEDMIILSPEIPYTDPADLRPPAADPGPGADDRDGDDDEPDDTPDTPEEERLRGLQPSPPAGRGKAMFEAGPTGPGKKGSPFTRTGQQHVGFTPIRGATTFSPILHAYFDWFTSPQRGPHAFEGTFEAWLQDLALDCLSEHWGLQLGVVSRPRTELAVSRGRSGNGHVR